MSTSVTGQYQKNSAPTPVGRGVLKRRIFEHPEIINCIPTSSDGNNPSVYISLKSRGNTNNSIRGQKTKRELHACRVGAGRGYLRRRQSNLDTIYEIEGNTQCTSSSKGMPFERNLYYTNFQPHEPPTDFQRSRSKSMLPYWRHADIEDPPIRTIFHAQKWVDSDEQRSKRVGCIVSCQKMNLNNSAKSLGIAIVSGKDFPGTKYGDCICPCSSKKDDQLSDMKGRRYLKGEKKVNPNGDEEVWFPKSEGKSDHCCDNAHLCAHICCVGHSQNDFHDNANLITSSKISEYVSTTKEIIGNAIGYANAISSSSIAHNQTGEATVAPCYNSVLKRSTLSIPFRFETVDNCQKHPNYIKLPAMKTVDSQMPIRNISSKDEGKLQETTHNISTLPIHTSLPEYAVKTGESQIPTKNISSKEEGKNQETVHDSSRQPVQNNLPDHALKSVESQIPSFPINLPVHAIKGDEPQMPIRNISFKEGEKFQETADNNSRLPIHTNSPEYAVKTVISQIPVRNISSIEEEKIQETAHNCSSQPVQTNEPEHALNTVESQIIFRNVSSIEEEKNVSSIFEKNQQQQNIITQIDQNHLEIENCDQLEMNSNEHIPKEKFNLPFEEKIDQHQVKENCDQGIAEEERLSRDLKSNASEKKSKTNFSSIDADTLIKANDILERITQTLNQIKLLNSSSVERPASVQPTPEKSVSLNEGLLLQDNMSPFNEIDNCKLCAKTQSNTFKETGSNYTHLKNAMVNVVATNTGNEEMKIEEPIDINNDLSENQTSSENVDSMKAKIESIEPTGRKTIPLKTTAAITALKTEEIKPFITELPTKLDLKPKKKRSHSADNARIRKHQRKDQSIGEVLNSNCGTEKLISDDCSNRREKVKFGVENTSAVITASESNDLENPSFHTFIYANSSTSDISLKDDSHPPKALIKKDVSQNNSPKVLRSCDSHNMELGITEKLDTKNQSEKRSEANVDTKQKSLSLIVNPEKVSRLNTLSKPRSSYVKALRREFEGVLDKSRLERLNRIIELEGKLEAEDRSRIDSLLTHNQYLWHKKTFIPRRPRSINNRKSRKLEISISTETPMKRSIPSDLIGKNQAHLASDSSSQSMKNLRAQNWLESRSTPNEFHHYRKSPPVNKSNCLPEHKMENEVTSLQKSTTSRPSSPDKLLHSRSLVGTEKGLTQVLPIKRILSTFFDVIASQKTNDICHSVVASRKCIRSKSIPRCLKRFPGRSKSKICCMPLTKYSTPRLAYSPRSKFTERGKVKEAPKTLEKRKLSASLLNTKRKILEKEVLTEEVDDDLPVMDNCKTLDSGTKEFRYGKCFTDKIIEAHNQMKLDTTKKTDAKALVKSVNGCQSLKPPLEDEVFVPIHTEEKKVKSNQERMNNTDQLLSNEVKIFGKKEPTLEPLDLSFDSPRNNFEKSFGDLPTKQPNWSQFKVLNRNEIEPKAYHAEHINVEASFFEECAALMTQPHDVDCGNIIYEASLTSFKEVFIEEASTMTDEPHGERDNVVNVMKGGESNEFTSSNMPTLEKHEGSSPSEVTIDFQPVFSLNLESYEATTLSPYGSSSMVNPSTTTFLSIRTNGDVKEDVQEEIFSIPPAEDSISLIENFLEDSKNDSNCRYDGMSTVDVGTCISGYSFDVTSNIDQNRIMNLGHAAADIIKGNDVAKVSSMMVMWKRNDDHSLEAAQSNYCLPEGFSRETLCCRVESSENVIVENVRRRKLMLLISVYAFIYLFFGSVIYFPWYYI